MYTFKSIEDYSPSEEFAKRQLEQSEATCNDNLDGDNLNVLRQLNKQHKLSDRKEIFQYILTNGGTDIVDAGGVFSFTCKGKEWKFYSKKVFREKAYPHYEWTSGTNKTKYRCGNINALFTKYINS